LNESGKDSGAPAAGSLCDVCGRPEQNPAEEWKGEHCFRAYLGAAEQCYRAGYEREKARAEAAERSFAECVEALTYLRCPHGALLTERCVAECNANHLRNFISGTAPLAAPPALAAQEEDEVPETEVDAEMAALLNAFAGDIVDAPLFKTLREHRTTPGTEFDVALRQLERAMSRVREELHHALCALSGERPAAPALPLLREANKDQGAAAQAERLRCTDDTPAWYSGHWREWHRGHGCEKDPDAASDQPAAGAPASPSAPPAASSASPAVPATQMGAALLWRLLPLLYSGGDDVPGPGEVATGLCNGCEQPAWTDGKTWTCDGHGTDCPVGLVERASQEAPPAVPALPSGLPWPPDAPCGACSHPWIMHGGSWCRGQEGLARCPCAGQWQAPALPSGARQHQCEFMNGTCITEGHDEMWAASAASAALRSPIEWGQHIAALYYNGPDSLEVLVAGAVSAAESARDAAWREALRIAHYDFIDGLHSDPPGHPLHCAECVPLRTLLYGGVATEAPAPPLDAKELKTQANQEAVTRDTSNPEER
jgi:hypothetical protein